MEKTAILERTQNRVNKAMDLFREMGMLEKLSFHDQGMVRRELQQIATEATEEQRQAVTTVLHDFMHAVKDIS